MIVLDYRAGRPIYEQIVAGVKAEVLSGGLRAGEALPSIRQMALELGVNPNTVAKAYQELERQGVVVAMQGRGAYISDAPPAFSQQEFDRWRAQLKALFTEMRFRGVERQLIEDTVRELLAGQEASI